MKQTYKNLLVVLISIRCPLVLVVYNIRTPKLSMFDLNTYETSDPSRKIPKKLF